MKSALCRLQLVLISALVVAGAQSPCCMAAEGGVGGLLIAPTRVELGPRQRSAELTLMNRGTKAGTYRLSLVEKVMTEDGRLEPVPEGDTVPQSAAQMVRFSPRQVQLEPGTTQKVRLLVRRPTGLADGEYRSHLLIQTLPDPGTAPDPRSDADSGQVSVRLVTMAALSIPVIVRHGVVFSEVRVADLSVVESAEAGSSPHLRFRLLREGSASTYGDVRVEHLDAGDGEAHPLGRLRGVALYTPNHSRWVEVPLSAVEGPLEAGRVRVAFHAPGDDKRTPLAVAELTID